MARHNVPLKRWLYNWCIVWLVEIVINYCIKFFSEWKSKIFVNRFCKYITVSKIDYALTFHPTVVHQSEPTAKHISVSRRVWPTSWLFAQNSRFSTFALVSLWSSFCDEQLLCSWWYRRIDLLLQSTWIYQWKSVLLGLQVKAKTTTTPLRQHP